MPSRAISNRQAYEFHRRTMEASLRRPVVLIDMAEAWGRNLQIAAQWQARYSRRRDFIQGDEGWGHPLQDTVAVDALIARNLAKEARWSDSLTWDATTRSVIEMSLKNAFQTHHLDVSTLDEPCHFGPSLRRLWNEALSRGKSANEAWQVIREWAQHRPAAWSADDERAANERSRREVIPPPELETPITWNRTGDVDFPWAAEYGPDKWQVRLNDFPDEHMYTLVVNGIPVWDFDDWPDVWERGDRERAQPAKRVVTRRQPTTSPVPSRFLDRYIAGECEAVWSELVALGPRVREPDYLADATAVARETMRRARRNIETIIQRLDKLGYRFWNGANLNTGSKNHLYDPGVFLPPSPGEKAKLHKLESRGVVLPLSLRMWMEEVGRVDLTGSHPTLCSLEHEDDFAGIYTDPLMVIPNADSLEELLGLAGDSDKDLFVSYDDWGKAAIGTNEQLDSSYSMVVPDLAADGPLVGERHHLLFVDYLRLSFRWGGFPGWERESSRPGRELATLTEHLLPI